jgi:cyclic pyranopterin phosphate synthase
MFGFGQRPWWVIGERNAMAPAEKKNKREVNYLRLSVTDRCNLRCMYCMPEEGVEFVPHASILSYEEMLHLVKLSVLRGIRKIRLTGGEPLVRKGFISFLERLYGLEGVDEITLTTNGVLLKDYAEDLRKCGICRVNISLDSLKPETFFRITGRDYYAKVWEGIQEAERVGFNPIKINVVVIRGVNDDEILDFARLTFEKPYHIRFIEFMPVGEKSAWTYERFIPGDEILDQIRTLGKVQSVEKNSMDGPAERYKLEGAQGELGLIAALSSHFCHRCNRMRLTAEGHLRGCLFSDQEIDLKTPLRQGRADAYLLELLRMAVETKPDGHGLIKSAPRKCIRQMSSIGG